MIIFVKMKLPSIYPPLRISDYYVIIYLKITFKLSKFPIPHANFGKRKKISEF